MKNKLEKIIILKGIVSATMIGDKETIYKCYILLTDGRYSNNKKV